LNWNDGERMAHCQSKPSFWPLGIPAQGDGSSATWLERWRVGDFHRIIIIGSKSTFRNRDLELFLRPE